MTRWLDLGGSVSKSNREGKSKPTLYDKPIPLEDLSFEELIKLLKPRLRFHAIEATKDGERVPGFDFDDIFQELMIKTHQVIENSRYPEDMKQFDYRFLRYMDFVYRNVVTSLWRSSVSRRRGDTFYRDALNSSLQQIDDFDKLIGE